MRPEQLHVISVLSNPVRYQSRPKLFREYVERTAVSGVTLWIVEAAFGEREHTFSDDGKVNHIRLRNNHELWQKEAMINAGRRFLPPDAKYIMWQDGDIAYVRQDWHTETLQQLQNFPVVQTFSHAVDLGPHYEPIQHAVGYAYSYRVLGNRPNLDYSGKMHPGYAWAWRREAWDAVGGMMDFPILGAGDRHMADGLIGMVETGIAKGLHPNYLKHARHWQDRAMEVVRGNIGYVPGTIHHFFHGKKADRQYSNRWQILQRNQFDPEHDITRDGDGLWLLRNNKPKLRDDIQQYFRVRSEDYHP